MMHVDMVYELPTWVQAALIVGAAVVGAILIEFAARRLVPTELRRRHNDVAAAMFGVIGVTFAVLLAFVVMLTFEGFGAARAAAAGEAAMVRDVATAAAALPEPARTALREGLTTYLRAVMESEWPAQAQGKLGDASAAPLRALDQQAAQFKPSSPAETNYHAALISALTRLQDARAIRQVAAANGAPSIVWVVMLLGGVLTVVSGSFLAAPSARMHMLMSATLAASGALVVVLIVALNQPFRGEFRVSTAPFQRVLTALGAS